MVDTEELGLMDRLGKAIFPKNFSTKEKIYYGIAQVNACATPFTLLSGHFDWFGANLVLTYGAGYMMQRSYNNRNGPEAMKIDWMPSTEFMGKRHYLELPRFPKY